MTYAAAERIVAKTFETGKADESIAAAQFTQQVKAMDPIAFADAIGDMLLSGMSPKRDLRMGMQAMLWIGIRRGN